MAWQTHARMSSRRHMGATFCIYMGPTQTHCDHTFAHVRVQSLGRTRSLGNMQIAALGPGTQTIVATVSA